MALLWIDGFDNYGTTIGGAPSPTGILNRKYATVFGDNYFSALATIRIPVCKWQSCFLWTR